MNEFFQRLKQRKLVQWAIAYVAAAFAFLQGIDIIGQQFGWPEGVRRGITLALVVGFFVTLVLAWYHGERGAQRVSGTELLIIGLVLAVGGGLLWRFASTSHPPDNKTSVTSNQSSIPEQPPAIPAKSIAVLPFENLSSDKENAYFADGIQDEILTRLSKIAALKVISRTSTQKYKSAPDNLRDVGKQLGVANLLEGSVQKIANSVHVNVQLIRVATDEHLWAESYNRKLDDVFSVEGEVAGAIAEQLNAKLTGAEKQELATRPTNNPAAYDAYLRGLPNMARGDEAELLKAAVHSFEEAVRLDPQFALAWAALSRTQSLKYFNDVAKTDSTKLAAENSLAEAVRLQPDLPETQLARADFHYWVLLDYKNARDMLEQLHKSWPRNAEVLQVLGWISARLGDWKKSANYLDEAIALNPRDLYLRATGCEGWISLRDLPTALRKLDGAFETFPNDPALLTLKVSVLQGQGQLDEAQSIVDRLTPGEGFVDTLGAIAYQAMLRRTPAAAFKYFEGLETKANLTREDFSHLLNFADLVEQSGDKTRSQALFARALDLTPDDKYFIAYRGYALAGLKQREAAMAALAKVKPLTEQDERDKGALLEIEARVLSRFGDKDHAIPLLQHLLEIPYDGFNIVPLTPALLRLDPAFDPLRGDPRFEKLCQEKQK
jgi:TolB-like protein